MHSKFKKIIISLMLAFGVASLSADSTTTSESSITKGEYSFEQDLQAARKFLQELHKDHVKVLAQFDIFSTSLTNSASSFSQQEQQKIVKGILFAAQKHRAQKRKNLAQTPYITHPLGVAEQLLSVGKVTQANIIIAALLHDTLDDTDTTLEELRTQFGPEVEGLVKEVSEDRSLSKDLRMSQQITRAPKKSQGAAMIKLSDRLYNLLDLKQLPPVDWSQDRIDQYILWTQAIVDRLPDANPPLKQAIEEIITDHWNGKKATK